MSKVMSFREAVAPIKNGDSIMLGGFGPIGYPGRLVRYIQEQTQLTDLFIISLAANEIKMVALEKLMRSGRCRGLAISFSRSSCAQKMHQEHKLEVIPQGTLAERIRAAGMGIPAFYTPVGVGTEVEESKEVREFGGRKYLMEKALHADVALIRAAKVDPDGNCFLRGTTKNYGALMPAAAKYAVVEAEELVPVGGVDPELVTVPSILIDAVVKVGR